MRGQSIDGAFVLGAIDVETCGGGQRGSFELGISGDAGCWFLCTERGTGFEFDEAAVFFSWLWLRRWEGIASGYFGCGRGSDGARRVEMMRPGNCYVVAFFRHGETSEGECGEETESGEDVGCCLHFE